jgi:phenylacetate-CoA ligase
MLATLRKNLSSPQDIYNASPRFIQRVLANAEAFRRDRLRRYGDYQSVVALYDPSWYASATHVQEAYQLEQLRRLIEAARRYVPYYRQTLPDIPIRSLDDLYLLPIVEKSAIRHNRMAFVHESTPINKLWLHATSGSTGAPLLYYHDRSATRAHQAIADALMAMHGCYLGERRVRFSGVYVAPYVQTKPPFWMFVDFYRQLQCSSYHLSAATYRHYLRAMREARVVYGTGYATSWHLLASFISESGETPPRLQALFTDSEGMSLEQQAITERAFGCPVFQTYGLGETGQIGMQCAAKRYHVLTQACIIEILDDADNPVRPGETGQIVVTDLTSMVTPFIRYRTGDLATLAADVCPCGWHSPSWTEIVGRVDDRIKTPEGRWIGRLSHVTKPGVGVRESQIVQTAIDRVVIRVVPDHNFDQNSMDAVIDAAHRYLGHSMQVSWERVESLPRMKSGKLRHVVREI